MNKEELIRLIELAVDQDLTTNRREHSVTIVDGHVFVMVKNNDNKPTFYQIRIYDVTEEFTGGAK